MKRIRRLLKNTHQPHSSQPNSALHLEPLESRLLLSVADHLRITEIMYNAVGPTTPAELANPAWTGGSFEYIELKNTGTETLNLTGVSFVEVTDPNDPLSTVGIAFDFTGKNVPSLGPGEYVLVVSNQAAFTARYGGGVAGKIAGEYTGSISNNGEQITLKSGADIVQQFDYKDSWYPITDGEGFSLTIRDAASIDPDDWSDDGGWRPSGPYNGSPGQDDLYVHQVVINELLAHNDSPMGDWIEFYNTTDQTIDMKGWFLSDDSTNLKLYEIPAGKTIPAHGYLVLNQTQDFGFGLSENGETVYLVAGNGGVITNFVSQKTFRASDWEVTFGTYVKSTGGDDFVAMATPTPGAANSGPKVGPIVISEIMYNPTSVDDTEEYIKLTNITGLPVILEDEVKYFNSPSDPLKSVPITVPWSFTDGIEYVFGTGASAVTIPAYGSIIIAKDPAVFTAAYGATPGMQVLGPFTGSLANNGENVELSMPGDRNLVAQYYILQDRVNYNDISPWPTEPDGGGMALVRKDNDAYGNDPVNWEAGHPLDNAPTIASLSDSPDPVVQGNNLTLTASGVADDYQVAKVEFYRQAVGGDVLLGTDTSSVGGWTWTGSTAGFPAGTITYYARVTDDAGFTSSLVTTTGVLELPNVAPAIGSLSVSSSPVTPGTTITITANNVTDSDGSVTQVEFYLDVNTNGQIDAGTDILLGDDNDAAGGWIWAGPTGEFVLGSNTVLARALDNDSEYSAVVSATVDINAAPTVGSMTDSPDPVTQGENITLTALNVADSDGTVAQVEFYRDANGNGLVDTGTDTLLGTDTSSTGGWAWTGSTGGLAVGTNTLLVRAKDNDAAYSNVVSTTVLVEAGNAAPTVGSLTDSPDPVTLGENITLTALNIADSDGTVIQVEFYRDVNSNGLIDVGTDSLLGTDTNSAGGWTWTGSTSGFALGTNTLLARAKDNEAAYSNVVSTTVTVNAAPTVGSLIAVPDPVTQGESITLTALNAADSDGTITQVEFYRDANGNGLIDVGTDTLLGTDTSSTGGWTWTGSTGGFAVGNQTLLARAKDNNAAYSSGVSTSVTVEEAPSQPPTIGGLTVGNLNVTGGEITLTANTVQDADGSVAKVEFYLDADQNGIFDSASDTLLGTDTSETDGWNWTGSLTGFAWGTNTVFARAQDDAQVWSTETQAEVVLYVTAANQTVKYVDDGQREVAVKISSGTANLYWEGLYGTVVVSGKTIVLAGGEEVSLQRIDLTESSIKTAIAFTVKGDGEAELGGITGAALGKLTAKGVDLTGDIQLTQSLGTVILDDIAAGVQIAGPAYIKGASLTADSLGQNVTIDMTGTINTFQVNTFVSGSLTADVIKAVKVNQGDLGADVTSQTGEIASVYAYGDITGNITSATFIKSITSKTGGIGADAKIAALTGDLLAVSTYESMAGTLAASNLIKSIAVKAGDITGSVRAVSLGSVSAVNLDGAILSAADSIGKVTLKGNILDSYILGGYDIGMDGAFGGTDDLLQGGNIKSVSAKGQFARSFISAGYLPESPDTSSLPHVAESADFGSISKVVFASKDPNPTFDYGIFAVTEIKPFKIGKEPAQTDGFFKVEIVGG